MTISLAFRKAFSSGHVDTSSASFDPPAKAYKASSTTPRRATSTTSTSTLRPAPPPPPTSNDLASPTRPTGSLGKSRVAKLRKDNFGSLRSGRRLFGSIGILEERSDDWVVLPRHSSCPPTPTTAMGQNQTKPAPPVPRTLSHSASQVNLKSTLVRPRLPEPPVSAPILGTHNQSLSSISRAIPQTQLTGLGSTVASGAPPSSFTAPRDLSEAAHAGTLGKKSFGLAGRLPRKGSRRPSTADGKQSPFGHGANTKGSYSDDLAKFEAAVLSAESRTGHQSNPSDASIPSVPSLPVDKARSKRHSLSDPPSIKIMGHRTRPSTAGDDAVRSTDTRTPPTFGHGTVQKTNRPTHHRRSSNNSVVSEKSSIKSSRRAEIEWRARVAALSSAHGGSPRTSVVEARGPVPPKRAHARPTKPLGVPVTPYHDHTQDVSFSSSLDSEHLVTPPHASVTGSAPSSEVETADHTSSDEAEVKVADKVPQTPARSFQSGRSFATLGIHRPPPPSSAALDLTPRTAKDVVDRLVDVPRSVGSLGASISPVPTRLTRDRYSGPKELDLVDRMRKASVPISVSSLGRSVSSFYFDNNGTHVSELTRPNSVVFSTPALGSASSGNVMPEVLEEVGNQEDIQGTSLLDRDTAMTTEGDAPLGCIEELDNVSSAAELKAAKAISATRQSDAELATPTSRYSRQITRLSDPPPTSSPQVSSAPRLSSGPAQSAVHSRSSSNPVTASTRDPLARLMSTPKRPSHPHTPHHTSISTVSELGTPYSPTTNYLLTAPIESLPWNIQIGEETPETKRDKSHPFARGRAESVVESVVEHTLESVHDRPLATVMEALPMERQTMALDGKSAVPRLPPKSPLRPKIPLAPTHTVPSALPVRSDSLRKDKGPMGKATRPRHPAVDVFRPVGQPIQSTSTVAPVVSALPTGTGMMIDPPAGDSALRARRQVPANVQVSIPSRSFGLFKRQKSNTQLNSLSIKTSNLESRPSSRKVSQPRQHSSRAGHAHTLAAHGAGSVLKAQLLGSTARRTEMDLTPGMESGERPPKTGLPMADLQRWLRETSITA